MSSEKLVAISPKKKQTCAVYEPAFAGADKFGPGENARLPHSKSNLVSHVVYSEANGKYQ